jgi:NADH:ubiquinone oxidoreductase subunit C
MSGAAPPKFKLSERENEIITSLSSTFGQRASASAMRPNRIRVSTDPSSMTEIASFARDSLHFDHCTNVSGTDFPKVKEIQVDYHLGSIDGESQRSIILALSCRIPSAEPKLHSLIDIYPSVELHERETFEMLGVIFEGHPDLSRLLLPEDWNDIPPLLKAYRLPGRLEGGE